MPLPCSHLGRNPLILCFPAFAHCGLPPRGPNPTTCVSARAPRIFGLSPLNIPFVAALFVPAPFSSLPFPRTARERTSAILPYEMRVTEVCDLRLDHRRRLHLGRLDHRRRLHGGFRFATRRRRLHLTLDRLGCVFGDGFGVFPSVGIDTHFCVKNAILPKRSLRILRREDRKATASSVSAAALSARVSSGTSLRRY